MSDETVFWDRLADGYAAKPIANQRRYEKTLEIVRKHLKPTDRALELGCGTGTTALALAPSVASYLATDYSKRMIEIANDKLKDTSMPNLRFERGAVGEDVAPGERFDVVMAFNLLHLVPDLDGALRDIHARLEPGGTLVSKTVVLAQQTRLWGVPLLLMRAVGKAPPVKLLTNAAIDGAITAAGFEIIETDDYRQTPPSRLTIAKRI